MLAYEHVSRDNLSGDDRSFFVGDQRPMGGRDYRTTRCNPGTLVIGTTTYAIPAGGLTTANAAALTAGTANRCDELVGQDLFPQQTYDSASTTFRYELAPWAWARDPIDARIVEDVRKGTGRIIDSENEVGGYPVRPETRAAFVESEWHLASMVRRSS